MTDYLIKSFDWCETQSMSHNVSRVCAVCFCGAARKFKVKVNYPHHKRKLREPFVSICLFKFAIHFVPKTVGIALISNSTPTVCITTWS